MMKKLLILTTAILLVLNLHGQVTADDIVIKAKVLGIQVIPYGPYKNVVQRPGVGGEVDVEFLSSGREAYQYHWFNPTIGLGLIGADLGAPKDLGIMFAVYPYVKFDVVNLNKFNLGLKTGVGLAALTKKNDMLNGYVSGFLNLGIEARVNFSQYSALTIEIGTHHMNNANLILPNHTLNSVYGALGYHHSLGGRNGRAASYGRARGSLEYNSIINIYVSAGAVDYYLKKDGLLPIGTFHADYLAKITNCYATGGGIDLFYNGTFMQQQYGIGNDKLIFGKYNIADEKFANKLKFGISWDNAFTMGRVTAMLDLGVYLWDPIRNSIPGSPTDRGLFYKYDPKTEAGWLWARAGLRCRVYDQLYVQASIRTHLYNIEGLELGIGYAIPMKVSRSGVGSSSRRSASISRNYNSKNSSLSKYNNTRYNKTKYNKKKRSSYNNARKKKNSSYRSSSYRQRRR